MKYRVRRRRSLVVDGGDGRGDRRIVEPKGVCVIGNLISESAGCVGINTQTHQTCLSSQYPLSKDAKPVRQYLRTYTSISNGACPISIDGGSRALRCSLLSSFPFAQVHSYVHQERRTGSVYLHHTHSGQKDDVCLRECEEAGGVLLWQDMTDIRPTWLAHPHGPSVRYAGCPRHFGPRFLSDKRRH